MGDSNLLAVTRRPSQEPIGSIRLTDLPCWPTAASQFSAWSKQVIASGLQRPAWCSTVKKRFTDTRGRGPQCDGAIGSVS